MALEPTTDFHPTMAELTAEVERCGWSEAPDPRLGGGVFFRTFQGGHPAPCLRYVSRDGEVLLLIGLEWAHLPGEEELYPRFLDLALEERMAFALARVVGQVDYVLLLSARRVDILRVADEVAEVRAGQREEYETALLPVLAALARGRVRSVPGAHRPLPGAESLGGWIRHWSLLLAPALETSPEHVERTVWKWILMLQVARRLEGSEAAAGGWGLHCDREDDRWTVRYDAISATEDLVAALTAFDQSFQTRHLGFEEEEFLERLRRLEDTPEIDRLRAELLMHSQNRFEPETVAWLFTDLAREQEGWRREVRGVEPVRRRMQLSGWTVYGPLVLEPMRLGLTSALSDTDRLADYLSDLNLFERRQREAGVEPRLQPDLFCPNPRGVGPSGQLDDGLNYLFAEALRLAGVPRGERFGIAVTFLLKGLCLAPRLGWPFLGVDTLDRIFLEK